MGTFDSDSQLFPGSCWRPYADTAWINQQVVALPVRANSSQMVARVLNGANQANNFTVGNEGTNDWNHPFATPDADDPVYQIHCWRYRCPSIEGLSVRIPVNARPAQGTDRHLTILDRAGGYTWDLYKMETDGPSGGSVANWNKLRSATGGVLYIGSGGRERIDGDGRGIGGDGANAAKTGLLAGPIRAEEMRAGVIPHALFIVVGCTTGTWVYPAQGAAGRCSDTTNAPPDGQYFRLNLTDAQIDALPGPSWRKTIWKAMARYGLYVGDTGGSGNGVSIQPISDRSYTDYGTTGAWASYAAGLVGDGYVTASSTAGKYYFNLASNSGINWAASLQAIEPCAIDGSCR